MQNPNVLTFTRSLACIYSGFARDPLSDGAGRVQSKIVRDPLCVHGAGRLQSMIVHDPL